MARKNREETNKYNKERYAYLKAHGICVQCGQRDVFYNHVHCPECIEKMNQAKNKYRASEKGQEKERAYQAERNKNRSIKYYERKEQGLCVSCGKQQCEESTRFCIVHLAQARRYTREQNRKRRMKNTKTLDELAEQRREVSRAAINKTHQTEGWFKAAHTPKRKFYFGKLAGG